jgi:alpha-L-rhamnosidase
MMQRSFYLLLLTVSILIIRGCGDVSSELVINDLKCENLYQPDGINTSSPRVSWKIKSTINRTSQKAYQIIAASELKFLNENKADLWCSEKIISEESVLVPWAGKKLDSGSLCYWKVRVWNQDDEVSDWSKPSFFSIGLINKSDWQAYYIGFTTGSEFVVSPQLRKKFTVSNKKGHFFLHVNSLGYHEVWINGEKVGDHVLTPAVSQFNKRSLAITYDISPLIRKGRNDLVLWIGQGWYSKGLPGVANNGPLVKAQIERSIGTEREVILCTDSSWTGRASGYSTTGTWRPHQFGGELVDGELLLPDLSSESMDNETWAPVKTFLIPDHDVTPQMTEQNRIMETIKPVSITSLPDSTWLIDMGKTLTGWFGIHFPQLIPRQEVTMEFCDHLDNNGKTVDQGQVDRYIATGKKGESFINKFNYHGFRYVKISNLANQPGKEEISASLIHTDYSIASSFECSDPDINKVHDMIFYTLRCLSLGGYLVDCPQIERLGYGGDGNASTATAQTMFDLAPLYVNWLQAWADCIRDDGGMPHTAPNPYSAGGGPYWCGFIITASWKSYQNFHDVRFLESNYRIMQQWLGYAEKYSPSGLLEPWPETEYRSWYLGDWATPEGIDQTNSASVNLVNNCFLTVCYETMSRIASVLGKPEDAAKYATLNKTLKNKIHEKYFDPHMNTYGSGSQIDLTYPLLAGVVPDSLIPAVKKSLHEYIETDRSGHFACGLVGIPVFTEWAVKNKEADLMFSMLKKKDYPGYLYMIENGATTTWEHWNGARSRIHNCYNGIGSWFYQAIGGIRPNENYPGYRRVLIDPQVPQGITWAKATKETPYGTIAVNWKTENKMMKIYMEIPVGCKAGVIIPESNETYVLNGQTYKMDEPIIELESGNYTFDYKLNK